MGILCKGTVFPYWQAQAIGHLREVAGVDIVVLILADTTPPHSPATTRQPVLWRGYRRVAARLGTPQQSGLAVDLTASLNDITHLHCSVQPTGPYAHSIAPDDVQSIREHNLDVILLLGVEEIRGEVLNAPRYGVWSFEHSDALRPGDKFSCALLQRLGEHEGQRALIRIEQFKTADSYGGNLERLVMGSVTWPARAARLLLEGWHADVFGPFAPDVVAHGVPSNAQTAAYLSRLPQIAVKKQLTDLFGTSDSGPDEWALGITTQSVGALLSHNSPISVHWLTPPEGRFYADPFVITRGKMHYIFFEEYIRKARKGHISVIQTEDFRTFSAAQTVMEQPFHLSYPCMFVSDQRCYCVPEQHQSGEVALYEAENFPGRWVKRATLLQDFPGVDPTVFRHEGRWWMFITNRSHEDVTHLYLFSADQLLGPWIPHPQNPVKTDRHRVRPAGLPLWVNGKLLRPAQDCSATYGGRIELHGIATLTSTDFKEHLIGSIEPRQEWPFTAGLHTMNLASGVIVFDAKRRLTAKNDFREAVRRKARNVLEQISPFPSASRS